MRKVIKIFLSVFSVIVLTIIIVPILVWLLLFLPPVQDLVARQFTQMAAEKLETVVTFDRVHLRLFNAVELDGFYVEDHAGDTLVYVGRLQAELNPWALLRGDFLLGEVRLANGQVNVRQNEDGTSNLGLVMAKLSSDNPRPVIVKSTSLTLDDMAFTYRKFGAEPRPGQVNFGDLDISAITMRAGNITVNGGDISLRIRELSLRDKSGFELTSLTGRRIAVSDAGVDVEQLRIVTPESDLDIETLSLTHDGGALADAAVEMHIQNSTLDTRTAAFFVPAMKGRNVALRNFNASLSGTLNSLKGTLGSEFARHSKLTINRFAVKGLPDLEKAYFAVDTLTVATNGTDLGALYTSLRGVPDGRLDGLADVVFKGSFHGTIHDFAAVGDISSSQGSVHLDLALRPGDKRNTLFEGVIGVDNLDLGDVLGNADLGRMTVSAAVDGSFGAGDLDVTTRARLSHLQFGGYDYRNVVMDGRFVGREFTGTIFSDDPNINFSFDGMLDFNDSIPRYDFTMQMRNADLVRLNVNRRDSSSVVRFDVRMEGSGTRFDNLNGSIVVDNLMYISGADTIQTGRITLTGHNTVDNKHMEMRSSFADADFRSRMSYRRLADYFRTTLASYIPSLSGGAPRPTTAAADQSDNVDNYSVISLNVKQANNLAGIFVPGLIIAEGTKASMTFNPAIEKFSLNLSSDYIELGNNFISKLDINSRNQADSLMLFIRADEVYAGGMLLPNFSVISGAKNNRITTSARFTNPANGQSALFGTTVTLQTDAATGQPQARIDISPSYFTQGDQQWNIFSRGITADRTRIEVRDLTVAGADQQLRVNGTASRSAADTLSLTMTNFDIGPLAALANSGYTVGGRMTGYANSVAALDRGGMVRAGIEIDSLRLNSVAAPPLLLESTWDFHNEVALFSITNRTTEKTLIDGFFNPADGSYEAKAKLPGLDMSLIDPHYEGILGGTTGRADADVRITGTGRKLKLNGKVHVHEYTSRVDYLNVVYTMRNQDVTLTDNVFSFNGARIFDPLGNSASADMRLDLNRLNNISYSFNLRPENMLVLNTTEYNNELFYGRVFASGNTTIKGNKRGMNMDITATTSANSEFYMPLTDKSDMADVDFVTFAQPRNRQRVDSTDYAVRRRAIMGGGTRRNRRIVNQGSTNINIALTVKPNTMVELLIDPATGHTIRARGNGQMNIHVNPQNGEFTMYGDYQVSEGTYLFTLGNIIEKPFVIEQGSHIQWTGDPIDALLNISAVYRLKASIGAAMGSAVNANYRSVRIPIETRILVTERLSAPAISFSIMAPGALPETKSILDNFLNTQEMMATQLLFLLTTGSFYDSDGAQGNIGAAAGSQVAFDFLSNQLSNWISSDRFNIGIRYRPRTELSSDEWGIDFSQQLLGDRLLLEVEGNYTNWENSTAVSTNVKNFTGDFYLTGLLDRTGNLKAKVFTRTIDRFDENQGLQESGVGLYYTEDFNTFGDILRNIKERFTGERRRKRLLLKALEEQNGEEMPVEIELETLPGQPAQP